MKFNAKINVFAKVWTREFLRNYENFRYYFFLKTFVLKTRKNEEKNDIRGATNGAQFIFLSNFQRKSISSIGLCRIVPFIP